MLNAFRPQEIYHVTVMPCFDKKLEASRDDFCDSVTKVHEVDTVLASIEIIDLIQKHNIDFVSLPETAVDMPYACFCLPTDKVALLMWITIYFLGKAAEVVDILSTLCVVLQQIFFILNPLLIL